MMRRFYLLILMYLPGAFCSGQYTYFNERLQPGDFAWLLVNMHLMEVNDRICFTTTLLENNVVNFSRAEHDFEANLTDLKHIHYGDTAYFGVPQGRSMYEHQDGGFLFAGGTFNFTNNQIKSHCIKTNQNHELVWDYSTPDNVGNNVLKHFFDVPTELPDGSIVLTGYVAYNDTPQNALTVYTSMTFTKLSPQGQLIWHHEYFMGDLFPFQVGSVIPTGVYELQNGDLLVFGAHTGPVRPIALKFDSLGNYISHATWGLQWEPPSSQAKYDGPAYPVRLDENTFVFVSPYETPDIYPGSGSYNVKIRLGLFDANTMTANLDQPTTDNSFFLIGMDFVQTPDNGFAVLSSRQVYEFGPLGWDWHLEAFIIKFDANRQHEWTKTYQPIVPPGDPNWEYFGWFIVSDLLVTSDGGFAFLGEVMPADQSELYAWLVKLDACGDVVFNGCPPSIGVAEPDKPAGLLLYPNPANSQLNIILPPGGNRAEVYSLSGQLVMSEFVYPGWDRAAIDVSGLAGGMYMVRVVKEGGEVLGVGRFVRANY
jgi:hypothetical protein